MIYSWAKIMGQLTQLSQSDDLSPKVEVLEISASRTVWISKSEGRLLRNQLSFNHRQVPPFTINHRQTTQTVSDQTMAVIVLILISLIDASFTVSLLPYINAYPSTSLLHLQLPSSPLFQLTSNLISVISVKFALSFHNAGEDSGHARCSPQ